MQLTIFETLFAYIVFVFAISIHESSHAWMAARCGDPTAKMLGRISLNPLRHLDPIGTVVLPLVALFSSGMMIGWAKPTPVDLRNLRNRPMDEILVALAGPVSNLAVVIACLPVMFAVVHTSVAGKIVVGALATGSNVVSVGLAASLVRMLYFVMIVNVWLAVFNLIPIPPLDGSRVLRHFIPEGARDGYDRFGFIGLILLVAVGGRFLNLIISPVVNGLKALMQAM